MRIFAACLGTETNTFAPFPTSQAGFETGEYFPAGRHPDGPSFVGAPLWAARRLASANNWQVIEGLCAMAEPSGVTVRAAYEDLRDEILDQLRAAMPVDVVALGMHGAMVAEGFDDCEGDLLARVRALVGPDVAVGAELDLHCHFTDLMVGSTVIVKSTQHFYAAFAPMATDVIYVAAPGVVAPDFTVLEFQNINRPKWPFDPLDAIPE